MTTTTTVPETIRPLRADDVAAVVRLSLAARTPAVRSFRAVLGPDRRPAAPTGRLEAGGAGTASRAAGWPGRYGRAKAGRLKRLR